jgi:subtilisin-like proprotein convertase family protein
MNIHSFIKQNTMFISLILCAFIVFHSRCDADTFQKIDTSQYQIQPSGQMTSTMSIQDISPSCIVSDMGLYVIIEHSGLASLTITLSNSAISVSYSLSITESPHEFQRMDISNFSGEYLKGKWCLHVSNQSDQYTATIQSWTMDFDYDSEIIIHDVQSRIQNVQLQADTNSNDFFETYEFDIAIQSIESNANYLTAFARIYCPVIDYVFHVDEPIYMTPSHAVNIVQSFTDVDFLGKVKSNLNLSFEIELWDETGENLLADHIKVAGDDIPVEGIPFPEFKMTARFDDIVYKTDADENGYFETFRFQIAFDPDVIPEISTSTGIYYQATTNLKIVIAKDRQQNNVLNSWWHDDMLIINGDHQSDERMMLDEKSLTDSLTGPSDIYVFLEIWDLQRSICLVSALVDDQALKLDKIEILSDNCDVSGNAPSINYHTDIDNDGYYEAFSFDITMDGILITSVEPGGLSVNAASVYGNVACHDQKEKPAIFWAPEPLMIKNASIDYSWHFTEKELASLISDNTLIHCHVEIWDTSQTNLLASSKSSPITIMADLGPDLPDFEITAQIENINYMADLDNDQFFETFSFTIAVDGDVLPESGYFYSATVYAKVVCPTLNQSFFLNDAWEINGNQKKYEYIVISEDQFTDIAENMSLLFEIELWDMNKQYRLASTQLQTKINADVIPKDNVSYIICLLQILSGVNVEQSCLQMIEDNHVSMVDVLTVFNNIISR